MHQSTKQEDMPHGQDTPITPTRVVILSKIHVDRNPVSSPAHEDGSIRSRMIHLFRSSVVFIRIVLSFLGGNRGGRAEGHARFGEGIRDAYAEHAGFGPCFLLREISYYPVIGKIIFLERSLEHEH
jgi:hypothetical protein